MAQNVVIAGSTWNDVPAVDFNKSGGGTARFVDTSDADAAAGDIAYGKKAYVNGNKITGTNQGYFIVSSDNGDGTQNLDITDINGGGSGVNLISKTITENGTYYPADDNADGYSVIEVDVSGGSATYSITQTTITWQHNSYITIGVDISADGSLSVYKSSGSGTFNNPEICYPQSETYDASTVINSITIPHATGTYELPITVWWSSGSSTDHNSHTLTYTVVSGQATSMNTQVNCQAKEVAQTNLTASGLKLTVAASGTYNISWTAWRSSSTGTMSTRLYVDGVAKDTDRTTWTRTYGQQISITGFALTAGQSVEVYARSGSTSRYVDVANLVIEQTA